MKKPISIVASIIATAGLVAMGSPALAATPASNYSFTMANDFTDKAGTSTLTPAPQCASPGIEDLCNDTSSFGTDADGNYWTWTTTQGNGGGIVLYTPAPLGSTFTYSMKFSVSGKSNDDGCPDACYTKLVDYGDLSVDDGIYFLGTGPVVVSEGYDDGTTEYEFNDVLVMTVTRDSAGLLTVYMTGPNGFETALTYDDSSSNYFVAAASGPGSILRLFQEEPESVSTSYEGAPGGKLYGFQAWENVALTEEEAKGITWSATLPNTGVDSAQAGGILALGALTILAGLSAIALGRRKA
jgi:LPXTG-motif cell wall-anchored protein